jgi:DHA1 family inner membrane transport protein
LPVGIGAFIVIGILSPLLRDLALSKAEAGAVLTVYALIYAITSPLMVALTGRLDRRDVLLAGLALLVAGSVGSAIAPGHTALLASRVVAALGAALFTPVASAAAIGLSARHQRARALGIVFGGLTLAQVAGVPLGSYLGYTLGWRSAFWAVFGLGLLVMPLILIAIPRAIVVPATSLTALFEVLRSVRLMLAVVFTALFMGAAYVVYTFISPMMEVRFQLDAGGVMLFLVVFGIGAVIGNAIGAVQTTRLGSVRTLVLLAIGQIVLLPALTILPVGLWGALALTLAWSLGAWSFMVPQQARLVALSPQYQGLLLALNASAIYVGVSLGSTAGSLAFTGGLSWSGLGPVGAVMASLALFSLRGGRERRGADLTGSDRGRVLLL